MKKLILFESDFFTYKLENGECRVTHRASGTETVAPESHVWSNMSSELSALYDIKVVIRREKMD